MSERAFIRRNGVYLKKQGLAIPAGKPSTAMMSASMSVPSEAGPGHSGRKAIYGHDVSSHEPGAMRQHVLQRHFLFEVSCQLKVSP